MRSRLFVWILFLCVFAFPSFAPSAMARPQRQNPPAPPVTAPMPDDDETHSRIAADMAKRAAKERTAAIKSDTDKLLRLSVELKQSVDKSGENRRIRRGIVPAAWAPSKCQDLAPHERWCTFRNYSNFT